MSKHILIFSQYFYPEQFRINDLAVELVNRGYKVSIVTGVPNYPEGKFYEGYNWKRQRFESWNGVDIYRVPIIPRGKSNIMLILNYISYVVSGTLLRRKLPQKVDAVFTYQLSPIMQVLPAIWYAKRKKIKHTLYVLDLWPESVLAITGLNNKVLINILNKMVNYIYKNSNTILTTSNSFKKSIEERGIPSNKIKYWPQYAEEIYEKKSKDNNEVLVPETGRRSFVFAGNVGYAQGLDILPKVAKILKTEGVLVNFTIIGDGRAKDDIKKEVTEIKVEEYFNFIDRQPVEKIPFFMAKFDVALITLSNDEIFDKTIPAKTQSLMACGKPLLVSANGELQSIIEDSGAGLYADAEDIDQFVKNVKLFVEMGDKELKAMSKNSLEYSKSYFDKEKLINYLEKILQ